MRLGYANNARASLTASPNLLMGCSCAQYDWLVREKIADGPLISKWRKPGYEILCSMLAIQKGNHNFGTTSHCRHALAASPATRIARVLHAVPAGQGPCPCSAPALHACRQPACTMHALQHDT